MSTGTIGRLIKDHGFGFIKVGDEIDLFFHYSEVQDVSFDLLEEGQRVAFKASLGPKGLKATNVKLLKNKAGPMSQTEKTARRTHSYISSGKFR